MKTLDLVIAHFPAGMLALSSGLLILLFILLLIRTFEKTGREIDQDYKNE